jgi:hypothetical protein
MRRLSSPIELDPVEFSAPLGHEDQAFPYRRCPAGDVTFRTAPLALTPCASDVVGKFVLPLLNQ